MLIAGRCGGAEPTPSRARFDRRMLASLTEMARQCRHRGDHEVPRGQGRERSGPQLLQALRFPLQALPWSETCESARRTRPSIAACHRQAQPDSAQAYFNSARPITTSVISMRRSAPSSAPRIWTRRWRMRISSWGHVLSARSIRRMRRSLPQGAAVQPGISAALYRWRARCSISATWKRRRPVWACRGADPDIHRLLSCRRLARTARQRRWSDRGVHARRRCQPERRAAPITWG